MVLVPLGIGAEDAIEIDLSELPVVSTSAAALTVVHPAEGARLPAVRSSFVYGKADPKGTLTVNGKPVPIHPGGGYLTMVEYSPGENEINADLVLGTTTVAVSRTVTVGTVASTSAARMEVVKPFEDRWLLPGEGMVVAARGPAGGNGFFVVEGVRGRFPLIETEPGAYRGFFAGEVPAKASTAPVRATLQVRGEKLSADAPGRLHPFSLSPPLIAEVTADPAVARTGPAPSPGEKAGYLCFPPLGVRFQVTGRRGDEYRVRLSSQREAYVSVGEVSLLPEGTPPPRAVVGTVTVGGAGRSVTVEAALGAKVPFQTFPAPDGRAMDVVFFGAVSNTDWIHYSSSAAVDRVEWFQDDAETYRLRVHTPDRPWWGYDARYESGRFVLELRLVPRVRAGRPLSGLRIAVDAGHSGDTGALGPTGLAEKDANRDLALALEKALVSEGATVIPIRPGNDPVYLYDRPKRAWEVRADILISVHNNALPEGGNPFTRNGYGVYYYQPQSLALAREIHAAYGEILGKPTPARRALRDDGLHYGNLALPRTPQMPAVLTESAYMIVPDEEAFLRADSFRRECARAMVEGLKRYVKAVTRVF
jgi:N-acetylmuramoyl-L-alanine amidase